MVLIGGIRASADGSDPVAGVVGFTGESSTSEGVGEVLSEVDTRARTAFSWAVPSQGVAGSVRCRWSTAMKEKEEVSKE